MDTRLLRTFLVRAVSLLTSMCDDTMADSRVVKTAGVPRDWLRFFSPDGINPVRDEISWTRLICSGVKNDASKSDVFTWRC